MQQRQKWSCVQQELDLTAQPNNRKFYFRTCTYILLTKSQEQRLKYELETGTRGDIFLKKQQNNRDGSEETEGSS